MSRAVTLTGDEGQFLLGLSLQFDAPEKLGAKTFSPIERMTINRDVMELYDALRAASPLLKRRDKRGGRMFGPEGNWDIQRKENGDIISGDMRDVDAAVETQMSYRALSGLTWLLVFACHPESKTPRAGIALQNDIVFPLIAKIRRRKAFEAELELAQQPRSWIDDEESAK